jgi:hypothetical protein
MPVKGCSPVGSTHVKEGPKSLKTQLREGQPQCRAPRSRDSPKETAHIGADKADPVGMAIVVDFELLGKWRVGEDDSLRDGLALPGLRDTYCSPGTS